MNSTHPEYPCVQATRTARLDLIWLEITGRCNLRCVHCYTESSPDRRLDEGMDRSAWLQTLNEARELGARRVSFIGGEPTLNPSLGEFIARAREVGYQQVEVYTNGSVLLSEPIREAMKLHRVDVAFSVYSCEAGEHDGVTLQEGSHARTVESIRWAVSSGLGVRVGLVATAENGRTLDRTRGWLQDLGVPSIRVDRERGVGRGTRIGAVADYGELCGHCWRDRLCVASDGSLYPCVFSRFASLGHVRDGLATALESMRLADFKQRLWKAHPMTSGAHDGILSGSIPCGPDAPKPPCGPEAPEPPCGPDAPEPPCNPDVPPVPCSPEAPEPPCGPDAPEPPCNPEVPPVPCSPEAPEPPCSPDGPCNPDWDKNRK